ncbi:MAG TPA: hypothetical protein DCW68_02395 [Rhodospirillaceae bacterium]|nr:MAG: hypothetical protein A2018_05365 [Alphaproteobacteria bacterium GWF2_58_20]HAU28944.1 hypothetical protein [Rhodospirillaceae bacterium]
MKNRILVVIDMQKGFVCKDGNLPIPAEQLIEKTDSFLASVPKGIFSSALFTQDTHFEKEYPKSEEAKRFAPHCIFGTNDWDLVVNPELLSGKCPVCHMTKNVFSMWGEKPQGTIAGSWTEKNAHKTLFDVSWNEGGTDTGCSREAFLEKLGGFENLEVALCGVASDYCNRWAMEGFLARGASVIILDDLTKGIGKESADVIREPQYAEYIKAGKLRTMRSDEYLKTCQPKPGLPTPAPRR